MGIIEFTEADEVDSKSGSAFRRSGRARYLLIERDVIDVLGVNPDGKFKRVIYFKNGELWFRLIPATETKATKDGIR